MNCKNRKHKQFLTVKTVINLYKHRFIAYDILYNSVHDITL